MGVMSTKTVDLGMYNLARIGKHNKCSCKEHGVIRASDTGLVEHVSYRLSLEVRWDINHHLHLHGVAKRFSI